MTLKTQKIRIKKQQIAGTNSRIMPQGHLLKQNGVILPIFLAVLLAILISTAGCLEDSSQPLNIAAEPNKAEVQKPKPAVIPPEKTKIRTLNPVQLETTWVSRFYDEYSEILINYVNTNGNVDYRMLKRKKLLIKNLQQQLNKLEPEIYMSWPVNDKIAFWINTYNIQLLKIIMDNYPIESPRILRLLWPADSIRHINKNIGGIENQKFMVMDEEFTLGEIKQRFFGKEFNEPRALLGISGACRSGPPLRNKPYSGENLDEQLNQQAKDFLSNNKVFDITRKEQKVYLSAMFQPNWYGEYFIGKYGTDKKFKDYESAIRAVLNFISNYIPEENVHFLETEIYSVEFKKYNWGLNEK